MNDMMLQSVVELAHSAPVATTEQDPDEPP